MLNKLKENKLYMMIGIFVVAFIAIILLVLIISMLSSGRVSNYSKLEEKLVNAAKEYYEDNQDRLPIEVKSTSEVTIDTLVEGKYIKEIEKITPNKETCTGKVVVKNTNSKYNYQAYIDCGDYHKTQSIADYIKANTEVVTALDGLYENNGDLIYRGERINNYIKFAGRTYRIVSINNDNTLTIIAGEKLKTTVKTAWDDRYNVEEQSNYGKDTYSVSVIRNQLTDIYSSDTYFNEEEKTMLETQTICVGEVDETQPITRNAECQVTIEGDVLGLLPISWYNYASLDNNCTTALNKSCQNYNYLADYGYNWWLLTTDYDSTHKGYKSNARGVISEARLSGTGYIRDVLRITNNAVYVSGDGSQANPYVIK